MDKIETKELILQTAEKLFANSGYQGVSIRDIATEADVNVASVGYHFGGKHNLFDEILLRCSTKVITAIKDHCDQSKNLEDYAERFFHYVQNERNSLKTTMRLLLSSEIINEKFIDEKFEEKESYPPGINILADFVSDKHSIKPRSKALWVARSLHFCLCQYSLSSFFAGFDYISKKHPNEHSIEAYIKDLKRLARTLTKS